MMRVFKTDNTGPVIRLQYNTYMWFYNQLGAEQAESMLIDGNLHIHTIGGTVIIPRDGSYVRFIADSWYSDIDVQNL